MCQIKPADLVFVQSLNPLRKLPPKKNRKPTDLDVNIEHSLRVDLVTQGAFNIRCQPLLVALLDGSPLPLELRIVSELQQTFEFVQVFKPGALRDFERFCDEGAETGVALVEPSAGSYYMRVGMSERVNSEGRQCVLPLVTFPNLENAMRKGAI